MPRQPWRDYKILGLFAQEATRANLTRIKNNPVDLIQLIWHMAGFAAPAAAMAVGVVLWSHLLGRGAAAGWRLPARLAMNFTVGLGVLVLGLVLSGADGRMLTYAALALVSAAVEAALTRRRAPL